MIDDYIRSLLIENLKHLPTNSQNIVISELAKFITNKSKNEIFLLKGFAGTGKTTLIGALVKVLEKLKMKSVLLAPTGRAAKVMANYTERAAYTVHKKIYRQKSKSDGFGDFILNIDLYSDTFFIVDESSMISNDSKDNSIFGSGNLLKDLIDFVFNDNRCKLILVGDTAQLPPVGLSVSPALEPQQIASFCHEVIEFELIDVVRQELSSGILFNATALRELIFNGNFFGQFPTLKIDNFVDIKRIGGSELIEEIQNSYNKVGINDTIVVVRTNKRANRYNQGVRNSILWREEELSVGDLLMVVKNNYFWLADNENIDFIANGDIVEVMRIKSYKQLYGFKFAFATVRLIDYKDIEIDVALLLDTIHSEAPSLSWDDNKKLYNAVAEDYGEIKNWKKRLQKIRMNPYFNALQVKFAYAVTCHKAQGGQWKNVFIDQGFIQDDVVDIEYIRWLYTAITRATEKVFLVNFKKEFFEN